MKMTPDIWAKVKHFDPAVDNFGDPNMMEVDFIYMLEKFRIRVNAPVFIHCGYELTGHVEKSIHGDGRAIDGHVKGYDLLDLFLAAERTGFTGIGLYDWGFHLDKRPGPAARWVKINGEYLAMNAVNIDILRKRYKHKGG